MTASFPTSIKTFTTKLDNYDYPQAEHINSPQEEIVAIQTLLGANGGSWIGEGMMFNGKISVTVASNNLTVAIKTLAGADPSTTAPVYVRINGTVRTITAALSVTKNAGTNWFNSGSAELATKEVDYFVYLIWNTTPATDVVDIGFARRPHFAVYSDASSTTTSDSYLAYGNGSAPTSTDDMTVIGRFGATLSAGAGYTWTVPTYTTANLIQRPVFETRILDWVPAYTNLTVGNGTTTAKYQIVGRELIFTNTLVWGNTTSISGTVSHTLPMSRVTTNAGNFTMGVRYNDSGTAIITGMGTLTATAITLLASNASASYTTNAFLSSTVPMTWTTNDEIQEAIEYWI